MADDEEISHLVRALYYWEEMYPLITVSRMSRTLEEYHEMRDKEKKREDQKSESKDSL